jgi:UDP-N-acetylglucosamine 4,6-dehydratase/5-epimerase
MELENKVVLITGNGSFAKEMIQHLLFLNASEIRVFSRNEEKQVETKRLFNDDRIKMIVGDIRDYHALSVALVGVDIVIHSAALKHIDICEKQPVEAIKTNVLGSKNVLVASRLAGVKKVICLSTDKAANAETCYGSTKYLMEKMCLGLDHGDMEVVITRYGNVLGSSGSVVPLFKKLASEGKPLTITDRNITRFFMSMKQAVWLVLTAILVGENKDLFVYNCKSATIGQLADLISNKQKVIGLRCVEKTGEALLTVEELNRSIRFTNDLFIVHFQAEHNKNYTEPFTSDNCEKLTDEELKEMLDNV